MGKRIVIICMLAIAVSGCSQKESKAAEASQEAAAVSDEAFEANDGADEAKSLNAIRFEGWTEADYYDNEYVRALRRYIDDFCQGKIDDQALAPFRAQAQGRFGLAGVEKFIMGGLFIHIIFLDMPDKIFDCWVYSTVDEATKQVTDYEVRPLRLGAEGLELTKEDILQMAGEHPEFKLLW